MKNDFISKGRSISDLKVHLVLTSKYRRSVFTKEMIKRLHEIFETLLDKWDCKLVEFNGEDNHVHLLFQYYPEVQLSKLVNNLKSVASRRLREEFKDEINRTYQKDVLWNGSYFVASCGGVTVSKLKEYIERQSTPED
ncbi:MAG: IS200/IS605 family transposase [Cyanobacteria bacterium J06639_18]